MNVTDVNFYTGNITLTVDSFTYLDRLIYLFFTATN